MKQLLLIRHGKTVANEEKRYCGWTDSPLCEKGLSDLLQKKTLCRYPALQSFAVYTSGLLRTEQTLQALFGKIEHICEPDFREIHFGAFENRTYEQLRHDEAYQTWITGDNERNVCPGGESGEQMTERVLRKLEQVLQEHSRVCLITHGGVISAIMAHLFADEGKNRFQWQPDNGCGYLIQLDETPRYLAVPFSRQSWEGKHFSFFQNRACEYFPCHRGLQEDEFNCLFCYCPLYALGDRCGGNFTYTKDGIKNCTDCALPHRKSSYGYIVRRFGDLAELIRQQKTPGEKET